jgi:predicted TIM-barrel fold metal-dependent hydrolase
MEVPWLTHLPSEYVREHVRLTTQPLERPVRTGELRAVLESIGTDMLLFATDYPHWDFDNPEFLPLPDKWAHDVLDANARAWYGLPARTAEPADVAPATA